MLYRRYHQSGWESTLQSLPSYMLLHGSISPFTVKFDSFHLLLQAHANAPLEPTQPNRLRLYDDPTQPQPEPSTTSSSTSPTPARPLGVVTKWRVTPAQKERLFAAFTEEAYPGARRSGTAPTGALFRLRAHGAAPRALHVPDTAITAGVHTLAAPHRPPANLLRYRAVGQLLLEPPGRRRAGAVQGIRPAHAESSGDNACRARDRRLGAYDAFLSRRRYCRREAGQRLGPRLVVSPAICRSSPACRHSPSGRPHFSSCTKHIRPSQRYLPEAAE